ncbi:hypothetical protein [Paraburkholderia tagetis]|uniref:Uncharacterized protein n=1 Tax=Paraburkholderia tagetis TaxID=2913261 RepID=A0A9X1RQA5_9BURK|nr:hypothetical protein [Paraburkholderia tagetis]MCG5073039.1 hypothetical protein [Paraburkholderia tagetis]
MAFEPGTQRIIAWTKAGCPLPGEAAYDTFMREHGDHASTARAAPHAVQHTAADPAQASASGGALRSRSGGLYLPWGPYLSADDVHHLRADLAGMLEDLATLEGWPRELLDDVMARAMRGPLADLLPNLHYFRERLKAMRAQVAARDEAARHSWRANEDLTERGYAQTTGRAHRRKGGAR